VSKQIRKILFLDIDGVLNCNATFARIKEYPVQPIKPDQTVESRFFDHAQDMIEPYLVARLNWILEQTGAEVVVSSAWRQHFANQEKLCEFLEKRAGIIPGRIIGQTPVFYPGAKMSLPRVRGRQIQAYLDENHAGETLQIVILDDNGGMEHLKPRFVQTDEEYGLTQEEAEKAIAILNRPGTEHLNHDW